MEKEDHTSDSSSNYNTEDEQKLRTLSKLSCTKSKSQIIYAQTYRSEWERIPAFKMWLTRAPHDLKKALCKWCGVMIQAKRSTLHRHLRNKTHERFRNMYDTTSKAKMSIQESIARAEKVKFDRAVSKAEASLSLFVADHCAVMTIDHLTELLKRRFSDSTSSALRLKRTKCAAIIVHILGPHFMGELLEDIGGSFYSLIIDESTDIAVLKILGIAIRYVSLKRGKVVTTYFGLIHVVDGSAETISKSVDTYLHDVKFSPGKCIGLGTDNANVMVGSKGGVHILLEEKWNKKLILIPCPCHGIELAVSSACLELPTSLEFFVRETYNWFSHSSIRQHKYHQLYISLNQKAPLKITQISNVRWLSIFTAIDRILDQYSDLEHHFCLTKMTEKCYTANQLHSMFLDRKNYCYLLFLKKILEPIYATSKMFESNNDTFLVLDDLVRLIQTIANFAINRTARCDVLTERDLRSYVDPNPNFGFLFEEEFKKLKPQEQVDMRERCLKFLFRLIDELRQRLPKNYQILKMLKEFKIENALRVIKPDIMNYEVMEAFNLSQSEASRIETQWANLTHVQWNEHVDSLKFWFEVYNFMDAAGSRPYEDLVNFVFCLLSLPISNAEVERIFSQMNVVKTKKRNRMKLPLMNGILLSKYGLRSNGTSCFDYEFPEGVLLKISSSEKYMRKNVDGGDDVADQIHLYFDVGDRDENIDDCDFDL